MLIKQICIGFCFLISVEVIDLLTPLDAEEDHKQPVSIDNVISTKDKLTIETDILKALEEFRSKLCTNRPSLEVAQRQFWHILAKCPIKTSKTFDENLEKFSLFFNDIYRDEKLSKGNLIFGHPANYWMYLKTHKRFFDFKTLSFKRMIKYKISSCAPSETTWSVEHIREETIENVSISFLDKEGFEIFHIDVGVLCEEIPALGCFEISENDYKKISGLFYKNFEKNF